MTIHGAFNDIAEDLGGTADTSGTIRGSINAVTDALAGEDIPLTKTIENEVEQLGLYIKKDNSFVADGWPVYFYYAHLNGSTATKDEANSIFDANMRWGISVAPADTATMEEIWNRAVCIGEGTVKQTQIVDLTVVEDGVWVFFWRYTNLAGAGPWLFWDLADTKICPRIDNVIQTDNPCPSIYEFSNAGLYVNPDGQWQKAFYLPKETCDIYAIMTETILDDNIHESAGN